MNDQYPELYSNYQWLIPLQFNMAHACAHRWAESPHESRRIAIYHESAVGQREVWTYSRLSGTANQLANGLMKMGVSPGDRIALLTDQHPQAIASLIAVFSLGAIAVPLSGRLSVIELAARLRDAAPRVAIVDAGAGHALVAARTRCTSLTHIIGLGFEHETAMAWRSLLARQSTELKQRPTDPKSPALLVYDTDDGGAGATLQGVLLSHRTLIGALPGFVASQNWYPQKSDIFWTCADWSQADVLAGALLPVLYFGKPLIATTGPLSALRVFDTLQRYRVTNTLFHAPLLKELKWEAKRAHVAHKFALRALSITRGGVDRDIADWCRHMLHVTPNSVYGAPEVINAVGDSHQRWPIMSGSIGRAYPGHQVAILNAQGRSCAPNVMGEIALHRNDSRGDPDPAFFLGYWRNELSSQARFVGNWFLTGDHGSMDESGRLWLMSGNGSSTPHGTRRQVSRGSGLKFGT